MSNNIWISCDVESSFNGDSDSFADPTANKLPATTIANGFPPHILIMLWKIFEITGQSSWDILLSIRLLESWSLRAFMKCTKSICFTQHVLATCLISVVTNTLLPRSFSRRTDLIALQTWTLHISSITMKYLTIDLSGAQYQEGFSVTT